MVGSKGIPDISVEQSCEALHKLHGVHFYTQWFRGDGACAMHSVLGFQIAPGLYKYDARAFLATSSGSLAKHVRET